MKDDKMSSVMKDDMQSVTYENTGLRFQKKKEDRSLKTDKRSQESRGVMQVEPDTGQTAYTLRRQKTGSVMQVEPDTGQTVRPCIRKLNRKRFRPRIYKLNRTRVRTHTLHGGRRPEMTCKLNHRTYGLARFRPHTFQPEVLCKLNRWTPKSTRVRLHTFQPEIVCKFRPHAFHPT